MFQTKKREKKLLKKLIIVKMYFVLRINVCGIIDNLNEFV